MSFGALIGSFLADIFSYANVQGFSLSATVRKIRYRTRMNIQPPHLNDVNPNWPWFGFKKQFGEIEIRKTRSNYLVDEQQELGIGDLA